MGRPIKLLISPEGCKKVAGGRSEAQTPGTCDWNFSTLTGSQNSSGTPPGCDGSVWLGSGGLRFASTTGYFLTALRAGKFKPGTDFDESGTSMRETVLTPDSAVSF